MKFKVGDQVEVLDEAIRGLVTHVVDNNITIEDDNGFPLLFEASQLVKISGEIKVSSYEAAKVKAQKEGPKKKIVPTLKKKLRNTPKMEVDLHISQLTKSTRGMSNHDMVNLQIETAKRQLEFAIRKRIQKVVFIHGVGEGVLKEELKYLFRRYENLKYYDADYQKYGLGATEVYIFQNG